MRKMEFSPRRYSCDHSFFDSIDTEAKAYWLGFIAADGSISSTSDTLVLHLSSKDDEHLENFLAMVQSDHPVKHYTRKEQIMSHLQIQSPNMVQALSEYGVVPRKTLTLTWPKQLDPDLRRHYLRGYFDGDGCFCVSTNSSPTKQPSLSWRVLGTEEWCLEAQRYLIDSVGVRKTKLVHQTKAYLLGYGGNRQCRRIFHLMYDDATVWLPRKKDRATNLSIVGIK